MELGEYKVFLENIPFWKHLGIKVRKAENGYAELFLPFKEELGQIRANMHGGALASLLDAAGAIALSSYIGNKLVATVEMKINYLKPVTPEQSEVTAHAKAVQVGSTFGVSSIDIKNGDGTLVATGIGTYAITNYD